MSIYFHIFDVHQTLFFLIYNSTPTYLLMDLNDYAIYILIIIIPLTTLFTCTILYTIFS